MLEVSEHKFLSDTNFSSVQEPLIGMLLIGINGQGTYNNRHNMTLIQQ